MALKLKTAPATTPVSLAEVKANGRVDHIDEDALIVSYINAAVSHLDGHSGILGRCMIEQTWELYYDTFPSGPIEIPLGNLIAVESIQYADATTGIMTTWDAANYDVDAISIEGWIKPVDSWPSVADAMNAVKITFRAGYGSAASSVPAAIRQAIILMVEHWCANRATASETKMEEIPFGATALLGPFRRVGV